VFGGFVELESRSNGIVRSARYRISAARFWSAFLPFERPIGTLGYVGDGLWLAIFLAPAVLGAWQIVRRKT
jgi:hypothetical protein